MNLPSAIYHRPFTFGVVWLKIPPCLQAASFLASVPLAIMSATGSQSAPSNPVVYTPDPSAGGGPPDIDGQVFPILNEESWWVRVATSMDNIRKLTGFEPEERAEAVFDAMDEEFLPPSFLTDDHKVAALWTQRYGQGNRGVAAYNIQRHIRTLQGMPVMVYPHDSWVGLPWSPTGAVCRQPPLPGVRRG